MPVTIYPGDRYGHTTHEICVAYSFWLPGINYIEVVVIFLLSVVVLYQIYYPLPFRQS